MWDRFFQKEFGKSGSRKFQKNEKKQKENGNPEFGQNRFKIDVNRINMDSKILPDRF